MTELFGIPLDSILVGLLLLLGAALGIVGVIAWRQPLLVRMGLRNIGRRPAQTALIVVGLMLSTLIISAAFATGDTVSYSITNEGYRTLGEVDFVLAFDQDRAEPGTPQMMTDADVRALVAAIRDDPRIDAVAGFSDYTVPVVHPARRLSEPDARMVGVRPGEIDAFRGLRGRDGALLSAAALSGNRVYISEQLATELDAAPGDTLEVIFDNRRHPFEVVDIVQESAITTANALAISGGGIVADLDQVRAITGEPDEIRGIALSLRGGVRDTLDDSDAMETELEAIFERESLPIEVAFSKQELITIAELIGSIFVTFFLIFGLFSIAAGVMLIFLIFVMLAAERRSEMGMARAVGMNRLHLTEMFLAEGMAYNLGSAAVGGLAGLGVAAVLVTVLNETLGEEAPFSLAFHFNWQGFLIAYALGVVLTFATVTFSAYRAANLNIVRAIRDLPEPAVLRARNRSAGTLGRATLAVTWTLAAGLLALLGAALTFNLFLLGLATYGLALVPGALVALWLWWGARHLGPRGRPLASRRARVLRLAWWVTLAPVAAALWALLRTREAARRYANGGGWAVWMLLLGALGIWLGGWQWGQAFPYSGGITLVVLAAAMLAVYFGARPDRALTAAGGALVWYWILPLPFSLFADVSATDADPVLRLADLLGLPEAQEITGNIEMFFVSGISITAAATLVVIFNAERLLGLVRRGGRLFGGIGPAVHTAVAYPLAAKLRTGMTLAMFGLVVFSLVVMATLNSNFTQLFLGDAATVGFDVRATGNPNNRIDDLRAALAAEDPGLDAAIAVVGHVRHAFPEARRADAGPGEEFRFAPLNGVNAAFLDAAALPFQARARGYESDAAVLTAMRADPSLVFADDRLLGIPEGQFGDGQDRFDLRDGPGPRGQAIRDGVPFDPIPIEVRSRDTGEVRTLRVIAFLEPQVTSLLFELSAIYTTEAVVAESFAGGEADTFYLQTADGDDHTALTIARGVEAALLDRGVQAESIAELIDDATAQANAFQLLFEGFMGLGLLVGIAALGVIAFRTVVERRQQIGMLRAIGYTRRLVAVSFFLESSFIALTGITMGLVLGLALSYNIVGSEDFNGGLEIDFAVPWVRLLLIGGVAYVASALMTLIPARSASRVAVAEALRYE